MGLTFEVAIDEDVFHTVSNTDASKSHKFHQSHKPKTIEASLRELKQSFLVFKIFKLGAAPNQLFSVYKVDLLTTALGPVHHSIELLDVKGKNAHCGKLSFNVQFTQNQSNASVKLLYLDAEIDDPEAHITQLHHYNVQFCVITFNEEYESNRSESRKPLQTNLN